MGSTFLSSISEMKETTSSATAVMVSAGMVVGDGAYVYEEEKHFTVFKTSMFFANDGFTVHNSGNGELVFRVDSYGPDASDRDELVLMDALGRCLLTVRKKVTPANYEFKRPSMHQRWEGFTGDRKHKQQAAFSVMRSSMMGRPGFVDVEVYKARIPGRSRKKEEHYEIEGSYGSRTCTVVDMSSPAATRTPVAEISRKLDISTNVVLGKDAFSLALKPGFDAAFAMGLVLVLDQISGGNVVDLGGDYVAGGGVDHVEEVGQRITD
ncbi:Protein LURP-one-related 12 [Linum grandiflorum]